MRHIPITGERLDPEGGKQVAFIKKEVRNNRKYLKLGPIALPYETDRTGEIRKVKICGVTIRYRYDLESGIIHLLLFGLKIPLNTGEGSKRFAHFRIREQLDIDECKKILRKDLKDKLGYVPNLDDPKTYNEKILWMKLYEHNPLIRICCDKYAVKRYVAEKIDPKLVLPVLGAWDDPEKIDFEKLPEQYVLKVNWSSGFNIFVRNKAELDIPETVKKLKEWMQPHKNSYYDAFNWGYKDLKPIVYAEPYIEQFDGQVYDYKFCFANGELLYFLIAKDRGQNLSKDFFDGEFNHIPVQSGGSPNASPLPERPKHYDKMLEIAKRLAQDFLFVRVDFYEVGDDIYLGEMTFYPGGGKLPLTPVEWDHIWGERIRLPETPNRYDNQ